MWSDVVDLRDFYSSSLGYVARRAIGRRLRDMWPDMESQRLLGLGYATPFLGGLLADRYIGQRRSVYIGGIVMAMFLPIFQMGAVAGGV